MQILNHNSYRLCTLEVMKTTTLLYCRMICRYIEVSRGAYLTWLTAPALANFCLCRNHLGRIVRSGGVTFTNATKTFVQVIHVLMVALALVLELHLCKALFIYETLIKQ